MSILLLVSNLIIKKLLKLTLSWVIHGNVNLPMSLIVKLCVKTMYFLTLCNGIDESTLYSLGLSNMICLIIMLVNRFTDFDEILKKNGVLLPIYQKYEVVAVFLLLNTTIFVLYSTFYPISFFFVSLFNLHFIL